MVDFIFPYRASFQWPGFSNRLHMDYETSSEVDLRKTGVHKYAKDDSTKVLMLGWAVDDDPVSLWLPHREPMPKDLQLALRLKSVAKTAFNAAFERLITQYVLKQEIPLEQWRCTMVSSYYLGFAGGLDQILKAVGLESKDKRGSQLINIFSTPAPSNHKATWYTYQNKPEEFHEFCQYCIQDVKVERQLLHFLSNYPMMHDWDWGRYKLDQVINDRGVPMDTDMAYGAIEMWQDEKHDLEKELRIKTGLPKVTRGPFGNWLEERYCALPNLQKETLKTKHNDPLTPPDVKEALGLWMQKEAKAVSKYTAVINGAGTDGRARGMFQFKGAARTDRTSGRRIQLQNLKRSFSDNENIHKVVNAITNKDRLMLSEVSQMNIAEALGGSIRHAISAEEGKTLVVCDLTSIESVVLGWLCNCKTIDDTFRSGKDSYKMFAMKYFDIPYDDVTKQQRSFSKPPVLGCGYMLGWKGLIAYSEGYGVDMTQEQSKNAVNTFRQMYPEIPEFWNWIYESVKDVIRTGQTIRGYRLTIERDSDFLRIVLPCGRALSYYKPEVQKRSAPWAEAAIRDDIDKTLYELRAEGFTDQQLIDQGVLISDKMIDNVCYMGMNDKNQWVRIYAHAGLFTENIVQSIAMDILFEGITNAENEGLNPVLQVHDEIGCEVPASEAEESLNALAECMTRAPSWAEDMWLGADGYTCRYYTKD